jgi:SAM-dependent methyltransferase
MRLAEAESQRSERLRVVDIGCGAGRNAVPIARLGCVVLGTDLSQPMILAAMQRARTETGPGHFHAALAPMDNLPVRDRSAGLIVAHGIWNLAQSANEFRRAVREAARISIHGAILFVFTFSRNTLRADARPVEGEPFVFTQFSGSPQCFLTADQLNMELEAAGFEPDPRVPLTEHNRPRPGALLAPTAPVIYEAAFRSRLG